MAFRRMTRPLAAMLAVAIVFLNGVTIPGAAAGMVGTDQVIAQQATEVERAKIEALLQRDDVRAEIEAFGVDPGEAEARVAALSDREIAMVAGYLGDEPAGEGLGTALAILVGFAAFFFITDILGVTNIYPFVRPLG